MSENTPNQPTKFKTKYWVKINDYSRETYYTNSQIKFKTSILRSSLCDYSDAYILVSGTIAVAELAGAWGNNDIRLLFTNCAQFTNCLSKITMHKQIMLKTSIK